MTEIKVCLDVYDNKQDKHPQRAILGWMNSEDKEKVLSELQSAEFKKQSCFSDIKYTMSLKSPELVIQAFLNPKKLAKCPTYAGCSWGCIRNMIEATCQYKRHFACQNNTVVNMLFNNKQIYVK